MSETFEEYCSRNNIKEAISVEQYLEWANSNNSEEEKCNE